MKLSLLLAASLLSASAFANADKSLTLTAANTQVAIAKDASPVVQFAAEELTNFLSQVLGGPVKIVDAAVTQERDPPVVGAFRRNARPVDAKSVRVPTIYLGETEQSRKAGCDIGKLGYDGFYLKSVPNGLVIVGRDDPSTDPRVSLKRILTERNPPKVGFHGTLFGVYEFLERFAGVRFYFPGELGTIVPKKASLAVPALDEDVEPSCLKRTWSGPKGGDPWFDEVRATGLTRQLRLLNKYRLRDTEWIPTVHGTRHLQLDRRFGKTHPEYFVMLGRDKAGQPVYGCGENLKGRHVHLCWSSKVVDELYLDAKAYLEGKSAASRGYEGDWPAGAFFDRKYVGAFDVEDGYTECKCEKCQAVYEKDRESYATKLIWGKWAELARRLEADGFTDARFYTASYTFYKDMPDFDLPPSLFVGLGTTGPWAMMSSRATGEFEKVDKWYEKTGGAWLHVHNWALKYGAWNIPDLPAVSPRSVARYYAAVQPKVRSVLMESLSDRFSHVYLNIYLMAKLTWNRNFDWQAALDEHYALMFGAGAPEMKAVFELLEDLWVGKVMAGKETFTALGPMFLIPNRFIVWREIYSPAVIDRLARLFAAARAKVPDGSLEQKRVDLFRREYLDILARASKDFTQNTSVEVEEARRAASGKPNLLPKEAEELISFRVEPGGKGLSKKTFRYPFKEGVTYRLSCYVKADVTPTVGHASAGATVGWFTDNWHFVSGSVAIKGSTGGWVHQSMTLKAGPRMDRMLKNGIEVWLRRATGTMEVKGLRLEEVDAK